ncbi:ribokinase-like protein [Dinothrombium tinctorium]|uniref:Ribokinase n=1 Tax=Dinothrombium tinctorium TaxID=1965070 RepID=A0A3S3PJY1_9ACAR|nr:ribokinase-like protein [Dinothrombium tinctorium]
MEFESESRSVQTEAVFMGACIIDLMAYASRFPNPGETLSGKHFIKDNGGKSANACVMAAKLGLRTAMLAKIGDDCFGKDLYENFKQFNINTDNVFISNESHSPVSLITVTDSGQNTIVYTPGTANFLSSADIERRKEHIFKGIKLFVSTFECKPEALLSALKLAKQYKIPTLINGAPCFTTPFDKQIFKFIDIFCVNEIETQEMTGMAINSIEDAKKASIYLLELGCLSAIITLGENGAVYAANKQEVHHIPSEKVAAVDTTGAGDAFNGALAYYLVRESNSSVEEKIRRACVIAAKSTLKKGTQASFPSKSDLPKELFL